MFKVLSIKKQAHQVEVVVQTSEVVRDAAYFDATTLLEMTRIGGNWEARILSGKDCIWLKLPRGIPTNPRSSEVGMSKLSAAHKRIFKIALKIFESNDLADLFD